MGERRVPEQVTYVCDGCNAESDKKFPTTMKLVQTGYDFQGCAVGASTTERLLCNDCVNVLNAAFSNLRESAREGKGESDE